MMWMWLVKFIQKRPSDLTIKISRILFWLILILTLYYNLIFQWDNIDTNFFWMELPSQYIIYIKYFFIAIWIIPLLMWITNICLLKKKYMRFIQIFFWIILFYVSNQIIPLDANKIDIDALIGFMWILPLIAGITWKCITSNCLKFGEKIKKIRI
jgi:hypothetical protein